MARKATIIGHAVDVFGIAWDVREARPTTHGWSVLIGWPSSDDRGRGGRGVAIILTQPLADYIIHTRVRDIVLPISRTAIRRLRRELGIRWDWDAWWSARADDLRVMTLAQFADKHCCSIGAASQRRSEL